MGEVLDSKMTVDSASVVRIELVRKIYTAAVLNGCSFRVKDIGKIPDFERLVGELSKAGLWSGVKAFFEAFNQVFSLTEENNLLVVKPIVSIEFCRDFDGKRGCDAPGCAKLHVCRHFVKGKCTFGPRCKKPHHFQNGETRKLLRNHFLDEVNEEQVREFLCRNVQHLLEADSSNSELPKSLEICKYYNVATGCTRESCPFLHVCRFYAEEGNCKFGVQCIRRHSINDSHARLLLKRYNMSALNEQQVMMFLKLKAEGRDNQGLGGLFQDKTLPLPIAQTMPLPAFPRAFSLPSTLFGALQILSERLPRKLSQPAQAIGRPVVSAPPPPPMRLSKSSLRSPQERNSDRLHEVSLRQFVPGAQPVATSGQQVQSLNSRTTRVAQPSRSIGLRNHERDYSPIRQNLTHGLSKSAHDNTPGFSHVTHNSKPPYLSANQPAKVGFCQVLSEAPALIDPPSTDPSQADRCAVVCHSLIPPPAIHADPRLDCSQSPIYRKSLNSEKKNSYNAILSERHTQPGRAVEAARQHGEEAVATLCSGFSEMPSSVNDVDSFFSRSPFSEKQSLVSTSRKSSASSSSNGGTPGSGSDDGCYGSRAGGCWVESDVGVSLGGCDEDLLFPYLPTTMKFNSANQDQYEPCLWQATQDGLCHCKESEICTFFLRKTCAYSDFCPKAHFKSPFQWQIFASPPQSDRRAHMREGFENSKLQGKWVNLDKSENFKLELAFSAADLDSAEIEIAGETLTILFEEMMAFSVTGVDLVSTRRTCDLSGWLLQLAGNDRQRICASQDGFSYKMRRLSTPSSESSLSDGVYATTWRWFWLDGFGMWRPFVSRRADVIDQGSTCNLEDVEKAYLTGASTHLFEEQQVLFDFKSMLQVLRPSGKIRKLRRRPLFISKEDLDQRIRLESVRLASLADFRLWYWPNERSLMLDYEIVNLKESSDLFRAVWYHFSQSMAGLEFTVVGIHSIQNPELWAKYTRSKLVAAPSMPSGDHFLFKACDEARVRGICQQGFSFCTCPQFRTDLDASSSASFSRQASAQLARCRPNTAGTYFMFCARTFLPVTRNDENLYKDANQSFDQALDLLGESCLNPAERTSFTCQQPFQVYPEFLISFRLSLGNGFGSSQR